MKAALLLVVLCACFEEGRPALPSCTAEASCPENAQCITEACTCNAGFHENSGSTACVEDISPGQPCETNNTDTECTDGAQCSSVTGTLQCTCKPGYHQTSDANSCVEDLRPGVTCEKKEDCVENSNCQSTGAGGEGAGPPPKTCVCQDGFHTLKNDTDGSAISCEADKPPGSVCTENEECIENSTCQAAADSSKNCMCNQGFHAYNDTCPVDTCDHTHQKCAAAGVSDCNGANAFVSCMLAGNCDPTDETELMRFRTYLYDVQSHFTDVCEYTASAICSEKVTGCFNAYLKKNEMCSSIVELKTCMDAFATDCATSKEFKLAAALQTHLAANLSCDCILPLETCLIDQQKVYDAATDNATKCSATRQLLTCGLANQNMCDITLTADHDALKTLVAVAFSWSQNITCDETPEPTTCNEQLAHCLVTMEYQTGGDFVENCRAIEKFGTCVMKSHLCGVDDASMTTIFMEYYNATSMTCKCPIELDSCNASAQIIPANPTIACSKLETYGICIMGAECNILAENDDLQPLTAAHEYYRTLYANRTCSQSSGSSCAAELGVCAKTLIHSMVTTSDKAAKCNKTGESLLCINGANCIGDAILLTSREQAKFRLHSVGCTEPPCTATNDELKVCDDKYEADLNAATSDSNKCKVKNTFVECLRRLKCNRYMKTKIDAKYSDVGNHSIPNCNILSLDGSDTNGAPRSLSFDLLTVLLATVGALAATAAKL